MQTPEDFAPVVGKAVKQYLDRAAEANIPANHAADMIMISRPTVYNWKKRLPDGSIPLNLLLNVLEGTKILEKALESGELPAKGREDATAFVASVLER